MPPRPMLPPDDLYARLELPVDCSYEAIEIAWRALLKRHHPDVAGPAADPIAKQINVAHDWLSDPELRARYDRERHPRPVGGVRSGRPIRESRRDPVREAPSRPPRRRPVDPEEALARHLDRIRRLTKDELDRLTLAETQPIAFVASIARFLPEEPLRSLETIDRRVQDALPRRARWDAPTRDAAIGFAYELLLGPFLDDHLSEPFRERVRERLARGWEAAVAQPRYGPNSVAVAGALRRLSTIGAGELETIAAAAARTRVRTDLPWPRGLSAQDDDGLRVSSALAQRDAIAALPVDAPAWVRLTLAQAMHGLVLRHGFSATDLDTILWPWRDALLPSSAQPTARRRTG